MSDFEEIEKELEELTPRKPSVEFSARVERALGDAGSVAMKHLPDSSFSLSSKKPKSISFLNLFLPLSAAALLLLSLFIFYPYLINTFTDNTEDISGFTYQPSEMAEDVDSPLHGVTTEQLEVFSGMPVEGWLDPSTHKRLIHRTDEGIVDRATGLPARQYRYHFIDETLWTHPATETRILSTTPRQEVYLFDLELF